MSLDVALKCDHGHYAYDDNVTHNLVRMAKEAGVYVACWHPERIREGIRAKELLSHLAMGLNNLRERPDFYRQFEPENGWGSYNGLVRFLEKYTDACREFPDHIVEARG